MECHEIKTSCEHCIFAFRVHGKQIDCSVNQLDNLKHSFNEETLSYDINGYCYKCRNIYWSKYSKDKSYLDLIQALADEKIFTYELSIIEPNLDISSLIGELTILPDKINLLTNKIEVFDTLRQDTTSYVIPVTANFFAQPEDANIAFRSIEKKSKSLLHLISAPKIEDIKALLLLTKDLITSGKLPYYIKTPNGIISSCHRV